MKIIAFKLILTALFVCSSVEARSVADVIQECGGDITQVACDNGVYLSNKGIDSLAGLSVLMRMVPDTEVIDLSYNQITSLNEGDFDNCEHVRVLHLFGQDTGGIEIFCAANWDRGLLFLRTANFGIPTKAEKFLGGPDSPRREK